MPEHRMRPGPRRVAVLALLLLLAPACEVGPDYVRPEEAVNDEWLEGETDARVKPGAPQPAEWWKVLKDPVLDSLIERAHAENLSLRIAGVRVLQAMAARGIAVGTLFPQSQTVGGAYSRSKAPDGAPGSPYASSWNLGFDAVWELDFWGKFRRSIQAADGVLDASLANYDAVMVSLFSEIAIAYVQLRTLQVRLEIARKNVKTQEDGLRLANTRFETGATSELDPAQARSLLAQTRSDIPFFEAQIRQTLYRIAFLLGSPPTADLADLEKPGKIPDVPAEIAVGIPADLLRRRPDIRLAERQAAAQSARIGVAEADLYPAFFLSGSLGLASNSASTLFDSGSWTGAIEPGFSWPVLNYGRLKNNVRVEDAEFQAAIENYRNVVLAAAQEVESGIAAYLGGLDQASRLAEAVEESQKSLDLANIQYAEGTADFQRVLDSLEGLQRLQDALTVTQGQAVAYLISTQRALGGGWEVRRGMDIVPEETRREMAERTNWGDLLEPDAASGSDLLVPRHDPSKAPDAGSEGQPGSQPE